jgi:hypothetical protein
MCRRRAWSWSNKRKRRRRRRRRRIKTWQTITLSTTPGYFFLFFVFPLVFNCVIACISLNALDQRDY